MSLLDDILNNKVSSNNSTEKKSSPRKKLLNDIVNNRVDTTPQSPDMDYSQSMAARLGARNRANLTLGKSNNKMYDFSVSRLETEAFRKYQDSRTANQDYLKAYSDYMKNPNRETKQALDNAKKNRRKKSDAYKLSRSDAVDALAEKNYEEANPLYKAGVKLVEPFINPIVDLTSTITKKKVRDSEGNEKYVDTTGFDAIHKAVTKDDGSLLSKGYNIYNSVVSTATKMAVSGFTGGAPLYYGDMFTDEYKNAINEGNDKGNAAVYAGYTTAMGIALDKIVGNAGKLIGFQNAVDSSATEQLLQAGWSKLVKNPKMSSILAGASSEGLSEGLEEFVDNIGGFFILNQDEPRTVESFGNMLKDTMPNAIYSAIVGSIVGGGTDALTNLDSKTRDALTSNETKQAIDSAIEGFENYKPDTVESAEAKERLITNLENTRDTINSLETESSIANENQTAPNTTEQVNEITTQEAKTEETASKEETRSEVASKEEPPKAKVSKPLNFREALTNYEVKDILQQINTYNQEQIEKNLITTERVKESYDNNKINLAYATLVMKSNNASDFSQTRAENYFKSLSKKLSDADKNYVYRNLDKTNYKLAEMAEKYFAPTKKQDAEVQEQKPSKAKNIKEAVNVANEELTLSKAEQKELNTKLSKFENMTKEQLTNKQTQDEIKSILSDYQTRSTSYEDADLKDIKKYIRNTKIKVSDNVKNQVSDYNDFRKSNFGNLKLTNDGTPIDEFWAELQEQYPQFSSEQVNGETDILEKLSDFVKQENTLTEEFTLSDEDMDDVTSKVFNSLIRNAESETTTPDYEISNEYKDINIPLLKDSEEVVLKITEDSSARQKQDTIKMLSEPQKNKVTVTSEDGTKFINPSENRNASMEEITKTVNNTESESERKQIDAENKKRRKSREKKLEIYKQQGNEDMVKYTQYQLDNDLYEVRHTNYEQDLQETKMEEDPEDFYKKFYKDYQDSKLNNKLTAEKRLELQDKATVLQKYYGNMELKTYNGEIAKIIDDAFFELGTPVGQLMQGRKNYYENLNRMGAEVLKEKRAMFNEEAKEHLDDPAWLKKNDPINPKSKYYTSTKDYSTINNLGQELIKIGKEKGITSDEYIEKATQLNKAIENAYGGKSLTGKLKNLTITNVLASTRIWVQNHKGNFINLGQYEVLDNIPAVIADKIMSTQTDMRTRGISFQGDVLEGGKGFLKGYKDTFYEFKNDLSLSNKFSRESSVDIGRKSIGHTFSNNNHVGKLLNGYERLVNFAIESGDRPYAMYYFEKSCYNQRMTNAQIQAKKQNTNMIYKETQNSDTGMYSVSYYDSDGKVHSGEFMTESEYKKFKETSKVQDLTEDMVNIAEQEALENTFQNDNRLTKAAVGIKKNLNKIASIGDYGLGDIFLKFTRTGSNMARALYEHSPMEAITLTKDLIRYNENLKNIDAETGKNSVTPQMQHKVATDFGKLVGGALVYVPIAIMNWGGKGAISRKDEDDKQTKFKNVTLGSKEYSIKLPFGDYTYKLSNDSTLESLIRQGVDIADLFNQTGSVIDTFLGSANSFVNSMIDMSFMSNILDMGSSYSDPLDNIKKKLASQPANMIPSFVKDISYTVDGFTKRNTYDKNIFQYAMNQIIDRTPLRKNGLKIGNVKIEGLTPQRNSWGEVRKVGADLLSSVWNTWLSGDTLSKISDDPVSKETIDIYMSTHDTDAMPKLKLSKNSFSYNGKDIELDKKEQDEYMSIYGKTAYNSIKKLMNTSQYKNASDDYKLKLLKQAYLYADEKAKENKIKSAGESFYNYKKKDNKFTEYRKPVFEEILENDISIDEAHDKRNNPNPYKLHTSITNWENYEIISKDIKNIAKTYSKENGYDNKTKTFAIQTYISKLNGLTAVQKAMISKLENSKSDYASYDDKILSYIKSLKLTDEEYKYMYDKLGLGGYYIPIYKSKKNK